MQRRQQDYDCVLAELQLHLPERREYGEVGVSAIRDERHDSEWRPGGHDGWEFDISYVSGLCDCEEDW